jgi:hypothetical protein
MKISDQGSGIRDRGSGIGNFESEKYIIMDFKEIHAV